MQTIKVDLCVIGAGSGGLSVAAGAVQMGASVALIESDKMGGDCLNYGCVPSKSLLAAAKKAYSIQSATSFGITAEVKIDFERVMQYVADVIKKLSHHDSVERFEKLGVKVLRGRAEFIDSHTVKVNDTCIKARRFVIASGSSPAIPDIPGLERAIYFTNETIFNLNQKPLHLIVIGGGPIGCELAQAFSMLGVKVSLLESEHILSHDDRELVEILKNEFERQGLEFHEFCKNIRVEQKANQIEVHFETDHTRSVIGSHLLIATGRKPNIGELHLSRANIEYSAKGIKVNSNLQTSNKKVYAIGDVVGPYQFTHMASYHAGIVLRNILFRISAKVNYAAVPWVTFTEPELAHVGLREGDKLKILSSDFSENDRAQTENKTVGKIKILTNKKGVILGVSILGPEAGELLTPWIAAVQKKKKVREMVNFIIPYPTLSEISKKVASQFFTPLLFSKHTRRLVRFLRIFG